MRVIYSCVKRACLLAALLGLVVLGNNKPLIINLCTSLAADFKKGLGILTVSSTYVSYIRYENGTKAHRCFIWKQLSKGKIRDEDGLLKRIEMQCYRCNKFNIRLIK